MKHIRKSQYKIIKQYIKHNLDDIEVVNGVPKVVYVCWFSHIKGALPFFTVRRINALLSLIKNIGAPVIMITDENFKSFEVKDNPIHEGFDFLSGNHKSDYVRAYMLYHYGGGYHDIKYREKSWENEWEKFGNENIWIVGRRETNVNAIAGTEDVKKEYNKLITPGWILAKKHNAFHQNLLNKINSNLDDKLDKLREHPALLPRDQETKSYPLEWCDMMGNIFHPLLLNYTEHIDYTLPDILYKLYK